MDHQRNHCWHQPIQIKLIGFEIIQLHKATGTDKTTVHKQLKSIHNLTSQAPWFSHTSLTFSRE